MARVRREIVASRLHHIEHFGGGLLCFVLARDRNGVEEILPEVIILPADAVPDAIGMAAKEISAELIGSIRRMLPSLHH